MRTSRGWVAVLASLIALAGCSSSAMKASESNGPVTWCGQSLLANGGTFGWTHLSAPTSRPTPVSADYLPPLLAPTEHVAAYSNVLIISQDCNHGATVEVTGAGEDVRVVGITYDSVRRGITAVLLGRISGATAVVRVGAFDTGNNVGQVDLTF